ncbi:hypothetical protein H257_15058 [Aphanomyces astaci]|uniref:Uncharacterized protein n=1 Tax=Aphanomyces astaci TaxID=112090 RepID=W4FR26_APHAT|nr:hypothetical protein H257_15058 [Aphanomyces astaci]ETV69088.1 hypothetical protein H257_15058 [Aphanomyces astaci]|eukprot:XP_009841341.1 hypothetical protein H257_15058 [Aphanomyces astaci]
MVSSQHLIRQALLNSRPKVWSVELPNLSQSGIDKYLDEEASFLKSTAGKKYDPERAHDHMRSSFQAYLAGTVHMESNVDYQELVAGARANLEESNTASNTYVAPDKDPFCLDPIYCELSSMPFGPNETRLPDETVNTRSQLEECGASHIESPNDGSESDSSDLEIDEEEDASSLAGPRRPGQSSAFVPVGPAEDYINRPDVMCKDISWFEFTSKFFRANRADGTSCDKLFMERHSLHKSKCIGVHRLARIPVLTDGVRVPFFGDCLKPEESDYHAQVALTTMSVEKKAAKTRTSREEEQNNQMENDDGRTEPDDFDDIDFENALLVASKHPATSHLDCDDARDTTSELYQAVSSSEMSNQVKFPTTTPIDADIAALVGGQSLDEASTTASPFWVLGTSDFVAVSSLRRMSTV